MKWTRRFFSFGLVLSLLAGVACSTGDSMMEPVVQPVEQPSQLLGGLLNGVGGLVGGVVDLTGGVLRGVLNITGLLTCQEQRYETTTQTIGSKGGTIQIGRHTLTIPKGALRQNVRIKAEQMRGPTNSVRFSPEGLQFQKPATLSLDYRNCQEVQTPRTVVYTTEELKVLEVLRSLDILRKTTVEAPIDHFSRYAVAY